MATMLESIADTLDDMKIYAPKISGDIDDIRDVLNEISKSEKSIKKSVEKLKDIKKDLADAIVFEDDEAVNAAVSEISLALASIKEQKTAIGTELKKLSRFWVRIPMSLTILV